MFFWATQMKTKYFYIKKILTTFTQKEILSLLAHKKSHTHSLVQGPFASSL
jgi:hypothetical protein